VLFTLFVPLTLWSWLANIRFELLNFAVDEATAWLNILEKTQRFVCQHILANTLVASVLCCNSSLTLHMKDTVYRKKPFFSVESDTKILQSTYFAYEVGIISSNSNRTISYGKYTPEMSTEHQELLRKTYFNRFFIIFMSAWPLRRVAET